MSQTPAPSVSPSLTSPVVAIDTFVFAALIAGVGILLALLPSPLIAVIGLGLVVVVAAAAMGVAADRFLR